LFWICSKKNLPVAQASDARALEKGFGVKKNRKRAAKYYKKAVNTGYEPAKAGLRRCTESGSL
jgi:TPR repeat protein